MSFDFIETVTLVLPDISEQLAEFSESFSENENKLVIEIAAIHAGLTSNYNMYTEAALKESLSTWVQPYAKPIILNHDPLSESVGRVMAATMDKEADGTPYVRLQVAITDPGAISKVMDERYLTGSVGGKCKTAKCSICGVDWAQPNERMAMPCKHKRGQVYNGKLAYFELGGLGFKEYSFVNMPADERSGLRSIGPKDDHSEDNDQEKSDPWVRAVKFYSINMNKESIIELNESGNSLNVLSNMKKKDAKFTYMNLKGTFLTVEAFDSLEKEENIENKKSTFVQNYTTIDKELEQKDVSVNLEAESAEENDMSKNEATEIVEAEEQEDILAVAEQLSADLATQASAEESTDELTEEEVVDEEELSESSDKETDSTEVTEELDETVQEEVVESDEEQLAEAEVQADEQAETSEEVVEETNDQSPLIEALQSEIEKLTNENDRLKKSLHFMLAERVVDAKISCGLIELSDRAQELSEHSSRTASSLADSLRDLERMPKGKNVIVNTSVPEMEVKTVAVSASEKNTSTMNDNGKEIVEKEIDVEDILVDVLMNRKPKRH